MEDYYDTEMLCTYESIEDDDDLKDELYKNQFLQVFKLEKWDDEIIEKKIERIYNTLREDKNTKEDLKKILDSILNNENYKCLIMFFGDDDLCKFKILFGYDLFSKFHKCLCFYDREGRFDIKLINDLVKKMN